MLTPLAVWKLSSLIASVCACFVVSMIVRQLCRNHFVLKFTALLGDHFIGMILISYLDGLMGNQWQTDYIWLNCLTGIFYFWALSSIPYIILHLTGVIKDRAYYSLCKHYKKGIDVFFYISLAIGLFARASWTELISSTFSSLADFLTQIIITASVVAVAFTFPCVKRKWVLIIELLIYLVDILFKINGGETVAFLTIMLLLGAAEKNSKWIMRIALTVELVLGIISYILSMNGFLPYNVISGGVTGLHEFGLSHPNAAGLLLLMICIMYVGLRDNSDFSNFLLDIAVIGFMLFFNYRYFSSVTSILCTGLLLVNVLLYRLFRFIGAHFQKFNRANNLFITILGFISYPLLLLISIIIPYSYYYRAGDYIGKNLVAKFTDPSTLTTRMKISFNALYNLPIRLFGDNYIENTSSDSYFNVDSFYVRLLTKYGILMTCSFLLLMVVFTIRCRKAQKFELILINCVMAVFGFAESSLLFFAYNPFILLVFSNLTDRKQSDRRVDRKRASHADSNQKVQD